MATIGTGKRAANRQAARAALEAKLLDAVERLLADRAYHEIGIDELVVAAGIPKSTFYYHFGSKAELLLGLADRIVHELSGPGIAFWSVSPSSEAALAEDLHGSLRRFLPHAALFAALADAATGDVAARELYTAFLARSTTEFADHIRAGQAAGSVDAGVEPDLTAGWLVAMFERGLPRLTRGADDERLAALAAAVARIVWRTLYGVAAT